MMPFLRTLALIAMALTAPVLLPSLARAADPQVPDPQLTPGLWHQPATPLDVLCKAGFSDTQRNVSAAMKLRVFRRYGMDPRTIRMGDYEIDHLVPLSLDGLNSIENLWPQSYVSQPANARRKDGLEVRLHRRVCILRVMSLEQAQREIATDLQAAHRRWVLGVH